MTFVLSPGAPLTSATLDTLRAVQIGIRHAFAPGLVLALRTEGFISDNRFQDAPIVNEFDACVRSWHIFIEGEGADESCDSLLGSARVTLGSDSENSVVSQWTGLTLPNRGRLVELSRAVVHHSCRREGLFGLMVVLAIEFAEHQGRDRIVALAKEDLPTTIYLEYALGFKRCAIQGRDTILREDIPGQKVQVHLLKHDIGGNRSVVDTERASPASKAWVLRMESWPDPTRPGTHRYSGYAEAERLHGHDSYGFVIWHSSGLAVASEYLFPPNRHSDLDPPRASLASPSYRVRFRPI